MNEVQKFIQQFKACVKEYKTHQRETRGDDSDIAYYFSAKNKKWLKDHEKEITALSELNCERPFMTFVKHFIYN